jgi:hypothetical protein
LITLRGSAIKVKSLLTSATQLSDDFRFYLEQGVGTVIGGNSFELCAITIGAVDFVQAARRIAGPPYYGGSRENIVRQRSWSGGIEEAGARLGFQANDHNFSH